MSLFLIKRSVVRNGFTLVELAIVLMIIGLLIGGILKGQELIQNARITTAIRQVRSYDAAVLTFMDSYGELPGDIINPSARLPNCSEAMCNMAGNGDGKIGNVNASNNENLTLWLHLATTNLIPHFDTANFYPANPLGGVTRVRYYTMNPLATYTLGIYDHWYLWFSHPVNILGRVDIKIDDGRPFQGDVMINGGTCGVVAGDTTYGVDNTTVCSFMIKTGF